MEKTIRMIMVALAMITLTIGFVACGDDDDEKEEKLDDRLVGTLWWTKSPTSIIYNNSKMWYEFTSATEVRSYYTRGTNNEYDGSEKYYTYTIDYPHVTFTDKETGKIIKHTLVTSTEMDRDDTGIGDYYHSFKLSK